MCRQKVRKINRETHIQAGRYPKRRTDGDKTTERKTGQMEMEKDRHMFQEKDGKIDESLDMRWINRQTEKHKLHSRTERHRLNGLIEV